MLALTASSFGAAAVAGIELDSNLIRRARDHLSFHASRSRPSPAADVPALPSPARDTVLYFPISSVLDHGHRPPPDPRRLRRLSRDGSGGEPLGFPDNVEFRVEDWALDVPVAGTDGQGAPPQGPYDTILALSVVKWIHLSRLDAGLERFLSRCGTSLRPEGYLVIELQPWSSYRAAVTKPHKAPHLAGNLAKLRLGPDDLGRLLLDRGLVELARSDVLPRPVHIYRKVASGS